ncbi:hypothetical protein BRC68_17690 [Halobacteriales archaeon QH_6_64_20]|nr:MAG: hypothetical protein BRC68_17690 [Halobacteriales archaeon QH_6_64_20]
MESAVVSTHVVSTTRSSDSKANGAYGSGTNEQSVDEARKPSLVAEAVLFARVRRRVWTN